MEKKYILIKPGYRLQEKHYLMGIDSRLEKSVGQNEMRFIREYTTL